MARKDEHVDSFESNEYVQINYVCPGICHAETVSVA